MIQLGMDASTYLSLRERVIAGWREDYEWAQSVGLPKTADVFLSEYCFVVLCSGMKWTVAARIWQRLRPLVSSGAPLAPAFGHVGKTSAMEYVRANRQQLFRAYRRMKASKRLAWLEELPWIGPITSRHLFRNLGGDIAKPDRHLARLAASYGTNPQTLCERLAVASSDRVGTVDYVIWRACEQGWISTSSPPAAVSSAAG